MRLLGEEKREDWIAFEASCIIVGEEGTDDFSSPPFSCTHLWVDERRLKGGWILTSFEGRLEVSLPHKRSREMTTQPKAVQPIPEAMRSFQTSLDRKMKPRSEAAPRTEASR